MSVPETGRSDERRAFLAFVLSGGVAAGVNVASRYVLSFWIPFEAAVTIAYLIGMTTAFLLSRRFAFDGAGDAWHAQYRRFAVVNLFSFAQVLIVSEVLARLLFPAIGFHWHAEEFAHVIGVISPILLSYYAHKHYSFRRRTETRA
jgi:putative flippase GtrA